MATTRIPTSLEIAQRATLRPIAELADGLGLAPDELEQFGRYKAKVDLGVLDRLHTRHDAP
jgi:methylenetetrahydrofolate dehydrogenase (NADP+)/methenyltetrahydrofolate cyclohydrolase/formyltetrahydrofolate synthetase